MILVGLIKYKIFFNDGFGVYSVSVNPNKPNVTITIFSEDELKPLKTREYQFVCDEYEHPTYGIQYEAHSYKKLDKKIRIQRSPQQLPIAL